MTGRLLAGLLSITLFVVISLAVPFGIVFAGREADRLSTEVERDARVVAAEVDDIYEDPGPKALDELAAVARHYAGIAGGRVVMVDRTGMSLADSSDLTGRSRDFSTRPEIDRALRGEFTAGSRESATLQAPLYYAAVPVIHERQVLGVVRVSYPSTAIQERTRDVWLRLGGLAIVVIVVAVGMAVAIATTMGRPVRELGKAADRLADGDLTARVGDRSGPPEIRQVARSFNAMGDRLQSVVEGQRAFLADASHQLRTPLTALRLRLESIAQPAAATDDQRERDLEAADAEVDRLSALVDGLLEMARLDARPPVLVTADADAVVAERVDTWTPLAEESGITLIRRSPGALPVRVVEGGLEQILDNLIANALEVAPVGSDVIVVAERRAAGTVSVSVTDAGLGLSEPEAERAFERFWRAPHAPYEGSGLGLPIVRRLAEISGGAASIEHPTGGGLRVVVELPAAPES